MNLRRTLGLFVIVLLAWGCTGPRPPGSYPVVADRESCPKREQAPRRGLGIALSGGGYRATLFHAGALRRLQELGVLKKAVTISSVSGGSITAGQLAVFLRERARAVPPTLEWNEGFHDPIHELAGRNIRSKPVLEKIFLPWNWFESDFGVQRMASEFDHHFGKLEKVGKVDEVEKVALVDLPEKPDFVFQATDLSFGVSWEFRAWRVGSYETGYLQPPERDMWSLGQAVAASAAFPPVFAPMKVPPSKSYATYYVQKGTWNEERTDRQQSWKFLEERCWKPGNWDYAMKNLRLQDGGVYDNLALEPIWKDREILLVSDAGGPLSNRPDEGLFQWSMRLVNILSDQSRALRKRMLLHPLDGNELDGVLVAYWATKETSIPRPTKETSNPLNVVMGYSAELAENYIANVRTDLDAFSEAERAILENHGYLLADKKLRESVEKYRTRKDEEPDQWKRVEALGLDREWPELAAPHPEWLWPSKTVCEIKKALYAADPCPD